MHTDITVCSILNYSLPAWTMLNHVFNTCLLSTFVLPSSVWALYDLLVVM